MSRREICVILQQIFDEIFMEKVWVSDDLSADDVEEWDSLAQVDLVVAIQDIFQIKIKLDEANKLKNVGEMITLISEKIR